MDEAPKPPTPTRRQAQAAARREQFLEVALDLFAERGFRGTTIRDIARAAGATEGLIYHYFPSKADLLRAVIERHSVAPLVVSEILQVRGAPVREALVQIGCRYLELLTRNRRFVLMLIIDAQRDPDMARIFDELSRPGLEAMLTLLEERVAAGDLRPHDTAMTLRFLHGSVLWFFLHQNRFSPPLPPMEAAPFVESLVATLLQGVGASR